MKNGSMTLTDFSAEIERRARTERDYLAPAKELAVLPGQIQIHRIDSNFKMNPTFQEQLAGVLGYPRDFWNRTQAEHPEQWMQLTNAMLQGRTEKHMVRTLDGTGRAFLSDRYLRVSNLAVANVIARAMQNRTGWKIESAEVTDNRMYIKVMTDRVREVAKGQPIQAGFIISNSETGQGAYTVQFLVMELVCTNGMVLDRLGMRRTHLGAQLGAGDGASVHQLYSAHTKRLIDQALMSATQDVIRKAVTGDSFDEVIRQFQILKGQEVTGNVQDVVEVMSQDYGVTEPERQSIFSELVAAQTGANHLALVQAITATARNADSYERAVELETIGGKVFDLTPTGWKRLNTVKPAKKGDKKAEKAA